MRNLIKGLLVILLLAACCLGLSAAGAETVLNESGDTWYFGFAAEQILPDPASEQPLYIAGYNSGWAAPPRHRYRHRPRPTEKQRKISGTAPKGSRKI